MINQEKTAIAFVIIYTIFASALIVWTWDTVEDSAEYDRLSAVNDSIIERNWTEIKRNAAANDSLAAINDSLWLELEEEISRAEYGRRSEFSTRKFDSSR